jgi:hypothetical protein
MGVRRENLSGGTISLVGAKPVVHSNFDYGQPQPLPKPASLLADPNWPMTP